jgi:hypothetical protein
MPYDRGTEAEAVRLVAERAADPDGPISAERMDRGFDVAEAMAARDHLDVDGGE